MKTSDLHAFDPERVHRIRITSEGQISLPASIRRRWGTEWLGLVDRGVHVELRPIEGDVVSMVRGALKLGDDRTSDDVRKVGRDEDAGRDEAG